MTIRRTRLLAELLGVLVAMLLLLGDLAGWLGRGPLRSPLPVYG